MPIRIRITIGNYQRVQEWYGTMATLTRALNDQKFVQFDGDDLAGSETTIIPVSIIREVSIVTD